MRTVTTQQAPGLRSIATSSTDEIFAVSQGQRRILKYQIVVNYNSSYVIEMTAISTQGTEKRTAH